MSDTGRTIIGEAVGHAQIALNAVSENHPDPDTAVRDLIADLGHWCDSHDIDFAVELDSGRNHYEAEVFEASQEV